jgi:hypothetical protein
LEVPEDLAEDVDLVAEGASERAKGCASKQMISWREKVMVEGDSTARGMIDDER